MSYPNTEREMYCQSCGGFFTAEGRFVRCSFDDPSDLDFVPEPCCPNCSKCDAIDAEDAPPEDIRRRDDDLIGDILDRDDTGYAPREDGVYVPDLTCGVCGKSISTCELCAECAEGNDPFVTSKYKEVRF